MKTERIFIIGFMGTERYRRAYELAAEQKCPVLDTDKEIERLDGRSILRLCMTMGEHDYRNKEYELLSKLVDSSFDIGIARTQNYPEKLIISCSDGILLDEMCLEILKKNQVILLDDDVESLWERTKNDKNLPYAFLHAGSEAERKAKFLELYERRKPLYNIFYQEKKS